MTYDPTVPGPAQRISDTQLPIQTNFAQANTLFGIDHFEFDAASDNGKHKSVTMPDRSGTPPAPGASELSIYARTSAGETFPFMRRDAAAVDIPLLPLKAFGECTVPGAVVTPNSFNISSVTRLGVGRYQFNFTNAFADTDYAVQCSIAFSGATNGPLVAYNSAKLTTSVTIFLSRRDGTGFSDAATAITMSILRA